MQNRLLPAIGSLCLGVFVFSLQDPLIKSLAGTYPVTEAMTIRSIVALPILLTMVSVTAGAGTLLSSRAALLALRAVMSFGAYMFYYMAIAAIPLAEAVALFFVAPLMIALMAIVVLGERLRMRTLVALAIGLVGVFVMLRPGQALFGLASLFTLLAAFLYGAAQILARKLGDSEAAPVITFYQNGAFLVGAPLLTGIFFLAGVEGSPHPSLAFLVRPWIWPSLIDFMLMASCGVIASAGMTLLSQAYRLAPAARVSIFEYTAILWAPLWGFLYFDEVPKITTAIGAVLICVAGSLALGRKENSARAGREREDAPAFGTS